MNRLCISFFGGVTLVHEEFRTDDVLHNGIPCDGAQRGGVLRDRAEQEGSCHEIKMTRVTQTLLAFLVLQRHRLHPRPVVASLLWGDQPEDRARNCLNTAVWRLRTALEPKGVTRGEYLITTPAGEIGFNNAAHFWLDAATLENTTSCALSHPAAALTASQGQDLARALQLYHGDLLEGFYDDWALQERERLRDLYLRGLAHLMDYYKNCRQFEQALACGQQILRLDPLREEIHRTMMRLYVCRGQRALAVRQYEICCQTLQSELGIPPMAETQSLLAEIAPELPEHATDAPTPATINPQQATVDQALQYLRAALHQFHEAQTQLRRATELVAQCSQATPIKSTTQK